MLSYIDVPRSTSPFLSAPMSTSSGLCVSYMVFGNAGTVVRGVEIASRDARPQSWTHGKRGKPPRTADWADPNPQLEAIVTCKVSPPTHNLARSLRPASAPQVTLHTVLPREAPKPNNSRPGHAPRHFCLAPNPSKLPSPRQPLWLPRLLDRQRPSANQGVSIE